MEFYTIKETAELLKLAPGTVRRYCVEGALPGAFRLTSTAPWRIPKPTIEALYAPPEPIRGIPPRSRRSQAQIDAGVRRRLRQERGLE